MNSHMGLRMYRANIAIHNSMALQPNLAGRRQLQHLLQLQLQPKLHIHTHATEGVHLFLLRLLHDLRNSTGVRISTRSSRAYSTAYARRWLVGTRCVRDQGGLLIMLTNG